MSTSKKSDDTEGRLRELIKETVGSMFQERDRAQREKDDPWERLRGMIRDEVSTAFEAFGKGLDEGKEKEGKGKDEGGNDVITALFGGGSK